MSPTVRHDLSASVQAVYAYRVGLGSRVVTPLDTYGSGL